MKTRWLAVAAMVCLFPFSLPAARAADPTRTIAFMGRLTDAAGAPLPDGERSVTFRLYEAEAGGAPLWSESKTVRVTRGAVSTALGDTTPFTPAMLFDRPYYLGVSVGADAEMTPRLPLRGVPYALAPAGAGTAPAANLGSPLAGLANARAGSARQAGSYDRSGGNADFRPVEPGQTITLLDINEPGVIERFWCTIAPRAHREIHRQAILRMYWDGESTPSVEVPIGDFFGVGFGEQVDFQSAPLNETSGGYNCYWPMPFHKTARWTLTNLSGTRIDAFYYNVDWTAHPSLPAGMRHFHAQWRRENPTTGGRNYTILEATGAGHYVGTALFMQNRQGNGLGFLEGDEMMYFDGAATPAINGTGTEDYFSSGWYYDRGPYSALYHGIPIKDTDLGRISTYRWHIEDAKPFQSSIRVTIEHGHANDHIADYSSVAYWYQTEPHAAFPSLPADPADLLPWTPPPPFTLENAVEGETLVATAQATEGTVSAQDMSQWGNLWSGGQQLWWRPTQAGASLTLRVPVAKAGTYSVTAYYTRANDYGRVQLFRGAVALGPEVNLYDSNVSPTGPITLGNLSLNAGDNVWTLKVSGKDARSTNYMAGIDAFVLTPVN